MSYYLLTGAAGFIASKVAVHYKQTAIGVAWAVIRPVLVMIVFTRDFRYMVPFTNGAIRQSEEWFEIGLSS